MTALVWRRSSAYSVTAGEQGEYAVSRATVLDAETRALVDRFSAWYVLPLPAEARYTARPAQLLGIRASAAEAKALCQAHLVSVGCGSGAPAATQRLPATPLEDAASARGRASHG